MKFFIVADVHGYFTELKLALDNKGFEYDNPNHILVVCGDLFDRGKEAVELYKFVKSLGDRFIYVRGNHEDLLFKCVKALNTHRLIESFHYTNGTVGTVLQFREFNLLDEVLDFIRTKSIDYLELGDYICVHGWLPVQPEPKNTNYYDLEDYQDAKASEWSDARWHNGIYQWYRGRYLPDKMVICGHWHCSYGHFTTGKISEEFPKKDSLEFSDAFKPFMAFGIIALDACTAYSGLVNCITLDSEDDLWINNIELKKYKNKNGVSHMAAVEKVEKKNTTETAVKFIVEDFPAGTKEIYLSGSVPELGSWLPENAIKMQYYQNEGTKEQFIATVKLPMNTFIEYKYLNAKTWQNVECGIVAEEVPNRTITTKNTKTRTVKDSIKGFKI